MQKQKKYWTKIYLATSAVFFLFLANAQTALGQWNKSKLDSTQLPHQQVGLIIENIVKWLLGIFGFVAVVGFVISGIIYLTAAGDENRQETAKNAMMYSITGVLVGLAGLVVIYAIDALYGGATDF